MESPDRILFGLSMLFGGGFIKASAAFCIMNATQSSCGFQNFGVCCCGQGYLYGMGQIFDFIKCDNCVLDMPEVMTWCLCFRSFIILDK